MEYNTYEYAFENKKVVHSNFTVHSYYSAFLCVSEDMFSKSSNTHIRQYTLKSVQSNKNWWRMAGQGALAELESYEESIMRLYEEHRCSAQPAWGSMSEWPPSCTDMGTKSICTVKD